MKVSDSSATVTGGSTSCSLSVTAAIRGTIWGFYAPSAVSGAAVPAHGNVNILPITTGSKSLKKTDDGLMANLMSIIPPKVVEK